MPLTAYHFGTVAPWGVLANLIGIPLTGLVIMPAGMAVLVTGALPGPQVFDDAALAAMQFGIDALLAVTGWFAGLPATPLAWRRRRPPCSSLWRDGGGAVPRHLLLSQKACPGRHRRTGAGGLARSARPAPTACITRAR